ncbi:MAG: bifunctional RNase H/acid phosphatase [Actinomycetales bacterium]|nr:bifunctional RNase H/acid phosphatase [Actinomycetales bacterium]
MGAALIVEADGGSRGNPGVAGYGALVRDAGTGVVLIERAAPLGKASNNVAEYAGLIAGLEAALRLEPGADVEVRMDSKLVVEQMAGRWKIKHEDMRRLSTQAQELVRAITAGGGRVRWTWIPREENKAADALSNAGMDGRIIDREPASTQLEPEPAGAIVDKPAVAIVDKRAVARMDSGTNAALDGGTRIILVRHGVTDFTVSGRLDGRGGADPALNEQGLRQAAAAAALVPTLLGDPPVRLITSSLQRVRMTGAPIGDTLGVQPTVDADWDERAFGDWDGLTLAQIHQRHPAKLARMRLDAGYSPPGGESRSEVLSRVLGAMARAADAPGTVVVVTSRVPILCVLSHVLQLAPERFWALQTEPASVSVVELWPDGHVSVPTVNRTEHLA